ncbi:BC85_0335 family putative methyltransferase [Mycoplasmopsis meleagridis]|uniref:BC85_0335 family putative methyltransferase n=1 Tax=Mycoplasmopsis meleagridis TaxID=29561 RepID=UPI003A865172
MNNIKQFAELVTTNMNGDKTENSSVKIGLIISIFVVVSIGALVYLIMFLKSKKIRKQILDEQTKKAHETILELRGENLAKAPLELKKFFKNKIDDFDLEDLINTTYLNKAENTLIIGQNIEYEIATLLFLGWGNFDILKDKFNVEKWNEAVLNYPDFFPKKPNFIRQIDKNYNLIFAINSADSNFNIYKKYFLKLEPNGMLVIIQNGQNKSDIKALTRELKINSITYEISHVKNKFLYIVKK